MKKINPINKIEVTYDKGEDITKGLRKIEFKDIPNSYYRLSNEGHIVSTRGIPKVLKAHPHDLHHRRLKVRLYFEENGIMTRKNLFIDTLVKEYFGQEAYDTYILKNKASKGVESKE